MIQKLTFDDRIIEEIRSKFPRATYTSSGRRRIYLDNGGGTLSLGSATEAAARARIDCSAEEASVFDESIGHMELITSGRQAVADLLDAPTGDTIVSGESTTSLLFRLGYAVGKECSGKENIVTTEYEHYANVSPWAELQNLKRIREVRFARFGKDGFLDVSHLADLVDRNTRVVTISAASNLLGSKSPLKEVGKIAREAGALFVVDAVHHVPHGPISVRELDCDFLAFSGYKLFSSHGAFLYGKKEHLKSLPVYKVSPAPETLPWRWEWGNRDQTIFAAITAVAEHLLWLGERLGIRTNDRYTPGNGRARALRRVMEKVEEYGKEQSRAVLGGFDDHPGLLDLSHVRIYGPTDLRGVHRRFPTFSFKVEGESDEEIVSRLWDRYSVALRTENYYSRAAEVFNEQTFLRASLVHYNALEEIGIFLDAIGNIGKDSK